MAALDINSSDYEDLGDHEPDRSMFKRNPDIGRRISDAILMNQAVDRPLSKKNARELTFAHGAPNTRRAQESVMNIWDTFCLSINHEYVVSCGPEATWIWAASKDYGLTYVLYSVKTCPSGEQIFRFIDTRARRMTPSMSGKTAPSLNYIRDIWRCLIDVLNFRHADLKQQYTSHDVSRISTHLDQMTEQGLLVRGAWRSSQWLGFKVIHRISQVWIERALKEGTRTWDDVLIKLLGLLLQASCGSRAGDVTRSAMYTGVEYLRWRHLKLKFKDRQQPMDTVQNLTLTIELEFTKGHKYVARFLLAC